MAETEIKPQQITKPIQLLGAWLAGLVIVDGSFLSAAAFINTPSWIPSLLAIAAVANVPIFLISLFLLQTKFRAEMQEDPYYSRYLDMKYSDITTTPEPINLEQHFQKLTEKILSKVEGVSATQVEKVSLIVKESEVESLTQRYENSRALSELFMYPNLWFKIVRGWGSSENFRDDVKALVSSGLAEMVNDDMHHMRLTSIGIEVAKQLETKGKLWNQTHTRKFG